jgi:tRNA-binding protein
MTITYDDFTKVDIRVGTIIEVLPYPEARRPAFKLVVDFGPEIGTKRSSAQVTVHYTPETLRGRQVLVLGFPDDKGEVVLIQPSCEVPNGGRLF